ncbi:MAG: hypothetical protein NPIRA06_03710 [Nitrospirales bacterium]|nr:MAG: hypothetical protein NPIRA06_03710 [Nitrospirales bacterium]
MNQGNSIALVNVCRDEVATPFMNRLHNAWNGAFNFSSLAGMLYLGVVGFQAAHHHAPNTDGRERYVYLSSPLSPSMKMAPLEIVAAQDARPYPDPVGL